MNPGNRLDDNDRELSEALRALAADGPREAPARIEERLKWEFRRHRRRRNLFLWAPAFGVAAAVGIALLVWIHSERPKPGSASSIATRESVVAQSANSASSEEEADASFYPLPEAEALPAVENAMVVRVQLPVSSLQLMGVPVSEDGTDASVQADLLLGQDGLARGVRLVQ